MASAFILEETTVRDSGQGPVLDCAVYGNRPLVVTLGITHAVERQSIELELLGSEDGVNWEPVLVFAPKCYCGSYETNLAAPMRYLKAAWRVSRWGGGDRRPYFRFYVFAESSRARAMAGAA